MRPKQPATPPDENTEQRILQAARNVFVRRGTAGARMQEIAEEAGVNQALLHYYFRSKDRLAAAVFREAAGRLVPSVAALVGGEGTIEEKVERFVHLYIDMVRDSPFLPGYVVSELHHHPERVKAMMSEAAGARVEEIARVFVQRLDAQLKQRAAEGTMRPITPQQFVVSVMGLVVMPFLGRPILTTLLDAEDGAFDRFLDERRADLPGFIMNAMRP
jgi:AcrR family transcriptional regulator